MSHPGGFIRQINASSGGVPKTAVPSAEVTELGLTVDRQRNRRHHGGPLRALCLFPTEHIEALNAEGHPIKAGDIGENITTSGVDWTLMVPGSRWRLGNAVEIEITSYTVPCQNIRLAFKEEQFTRVSQKLHPGWARMYARVLKTGEIKPGDRILYLGSE